MTYGESVGTVAGAAWTESLVLVGASGGADLAARPPAPPDAAAASRLGHRGGPHVLRAAVTAPPLLHLQVAP